MAVSWAVFVHQPFARAEYSTTVNPSVNWGTWQGWGVSLAWWAQAFGNQGNLADIFFTTNNTTLNGQQLPGLGLNIVRYNLGASSNTPANGQNMQASPNIKPARQMQAFWTDWNSANPTSSSWNWNVDANQVAMLEMAKARGANIFQLFSNSPVWWMCYNHNPSGADVGSNDNLQSWNYQQDAVYLATVAKYAADHWGIQFNTVEPFNEPSANWWTATGTQEGCHFDVTTQATVINYLRSEMNSMGLTNTAIAASDENNYNAATTTWNSFSATTQSQVGQVDVHGYAYGGGGRSQLYQAVAGKTLWDSEYGDSDGSGMSLASNLNLDFQSLHMTAWCYWQALDINGWGLIQANSSLTTIGSVNPKYYVLAQYTRSIRPGMTILNSGDGNTVSAYDPVNHDLVLVTTNSGAAQWVTYNLADFYSAANGPVQGWYTVPNAGVNYQPLNNIVLSNDLVRVWYPAGSVQTLEIPNVFLAPPTASTWTSSKTTGNWSNPASWSPVTIPDQGTNVTFGAGSATCVLDGVSRTVGSILFSGSAGFAISSSGSAGLTINSGITVSNSFTNSIAAPIAIAQANTWAVNGPGSLLVSGNVSGANSLTKTGSGKLILSGSNTYTGPTTINQGQLVVDGWLTNSPVSVASGGTLGGTGHLSSVTINAGGQLAPGDLNTGALVIAGSVGFQNGELDIVGAGSSITSVSIAGNLSLNEATLDVSGSLAAGTYTIASYGGTLSGRFAALDIPPGYTVEYGTGNDSSITLSAVPEPSTFVLLGVGVIVLAACAWRERRSSRETST